MSHARIPVELPFACGPVSADTLLLEAEGFEAAARLLDSHADYRVLRRLRSRPVLGGRPLLTGERTCVVVDTETTGLDPARDEIVEIGMLSFVYDPAGVIVDVFGVFDALREPAMPIGPEITRLTGITPAMVKGRSIDPADVEAFIAGANLIVAHNAAFDRPFLERFAGGFTRKAWGCSLAEVPWSEFGYQGAKLSYLLGEHGWFFDAHRAVDDCHALFELLAARLPDGATAFGHLLQSARRARVRIWAEGAPYGRKDMLKGRGYRWSDGKEGRPKSWFVDVDEAGLDSELSLLRDVVYRRPVTLPIQRLTAFERYRTPGLE